ncbi:NEP1-interacting protein 1-like [Nymphaea colorata]|nr:NEP1-interacting protein 1-like [Nymphaea colorata]
MLVGTRDALQGPITVVTSSFLRFFGSNLLFPFGYTTSCEEAGIPYPSCGEFFICSAAPKETYKARLVILLEQEIKMARFCRLWDVLWSSCFAILSCIFVLVGAFVGMITGAIVGETKEIGFFDGAAVGAFSGVILSMEVLESMVYGRLLSLEAIIFSMLNGRVLTEWVTPAIETALQQQVDGVDTSPEVAFNIFSSGSTMGLLQDSIQKLQLFDISYKQKHDVYVHQTSCAICLQAVFISLARMFELLNFFNVFSVTGLAEIPEIL